MGLKLSSKLPASQNHRRRAPARAQELSSPSRETAERHVKGLAHITGGGLIDNLRASCPNPPTPSSTRNCGKVPAIYDHIRTGGQIDRTEMYQVFNMGIGMTVVVSAADRAKALKLTKGRSSPDRKGRGMVRLSF